MLSLFATLISAQEQADTMYISLSKGRVLKYAVSEIYSMGFEPVYAPEFPAVDSTAVELVYSPGWDNNKTHLSKNVNDLLTVAGVEYADTLGSVEITDEQYKEIKEFTDELVADAKNQKEIYDKCFAWIVNNIKYSNRYPDGSVVDNNAYPVFNTGYGICQGYSNLLVVMLQSQGVPSFIVGGYIPEGGHAWCYVNCDGIWYVSDPTNGRDILMDKYNTYSSTFMPTNLDVVLFKEDGLSYEYYASQLTVRGIEGESAIVVIPYSVKGFKITSVNPNHVSPSLKELYIGENIEMFADLSQGFVNGLNEHATALEYVSVDPNNAHLKSHEGVVYDKENNTIILIPAAMKRVKLLPIEFGKDTGVQGHKNVEEIVFAEGTGSIGDYVVSDCPNLKVAYIPLGTIVSNNAFYNVHSSFDIVYY